MKNVLFILSIVVASFINVNATEDTKHLIDSTSYDYAEVDLVTFNSIKDSLRCQPNLEFHYSNTAYADIDKYTLKSELDMLKSGIIPDKEGAWMQSGWIKYADDWENKDRLGNKIYVTISTSEIDGLVITTIQYMSGMLSLSEKGQNKAR